MNNFSYDEMQMLTDGGWSGDFIENICEGDEVAIKAFPKEGEPPIKFITVAELKKIARYDTDYWTGGRLNSDPNYLMQFIGVHESGLREPLSFGAGWAIFRRATAEVRASA